MFAAEIAGQEISGRLGCRTDDAWTLAGLSVLERGADKAWVCVPQDLTGGVSQLLVVPQGDAQSDPARVLAQPRRRPRIPPLGCQLPVAPGDRRARSESSHGGIGDYGPARLRQATRLEVVHEAVECRCGVFVEYGCDGQVHREVVRILDEIQQRPARLRSCDGAQRVARGGAHGLKRAVGPEFGQQRHGGRMLRLAELFDSVCQILGILHPADGDKAGLECPRAFLLAEPGALRVRAPPALRKVRRKQDRLLECVEQAIETVVAHRCTRGIALLRRTGD